MALPLSALGIEVHWDGACAACGRPLYNGQVLTVVHSATQGALVLLRLAHGACLS